MSFLFLLNEHCVILVLTELLREQQTSCEPCPGGTYQDATSQTSCKACTAGNYCPEGAAAELPEPPDLR